MMAGSRLLMAFVLSAALLSNLAAGQSCAQFSLFAAGSVDAEPGASVDIDLAVKNTGTCAGETLVVLDLPEGWSAVPKQFETGTIEPDTIHPETIQVSIPADAQTSSITILEESAEPLTIQINIAGSPAPEQNQTANQNETQPVQPPAEQPLIVTTPEIPINQTPAPEQPPAAEAQEQEQPQAQQTSGEVTGLLTGNPVTQIAVIILLAFGAGYFIGSRGQGFRYRFTSS